MKNKNLLIFLGMIILFCSFVVTAAAFGNPSQGNLGYNNVQNYRPSFTELYSSTSNGQISARDLWPSVNSIENDQCEANTDFIIGIPPGGCSPSVVRSDLLAEQNVPVFCQLYAIKVNPLIKTSSIRTISFQGDYPDGVRSISFHPARAAVNSYRTLLGDPYINNIGYVVIVLDQQRDEENLTDWIAGELTARIRYDADDAYGASRSEYFLKPLSENDWQSQFAASSFFGGRGFARVESMDSGQARIGLYRSQEESPYRTVTLNEGETSQSIYFPGYYCRAGLKVKLNDFVGPEDEVLLNIDGQYSWAREGTKFFDSQCTVRNIDINEKEHIAAKKATSSDDSKKGETGDKKVVDPVVDPNTEAVGTPKAPEGLSQTEQCRWGNGEKIIKHARDLKAANPSKINDEDVKRDTGAKNFECLALQLAYRESILTHCGVQNGGAITECSEQCSSNFVDIIEGPTGERGIMQLSYKTFPKEGDVDPYLDDDANILAGLNYLMTRSKSERLYECGEIGKLETYSGWNSALRWYNGWGCYGGNEDYVEDVGGFNDEIIALYPDVCGSGYSNIGGAGAIPGTTDTTREITSTTPTASSGPTGSSSSSSSSTFVPKEKDKPYYVGSVDFTCPGNRFELSLFRNVDGELQVSEVEFDGLTDGVFEDANSTANSLLADYPFEAREQSLQSYSENTLYEQIILSKKLGKQKTEKALLEIFIEKYPTSEIIETVRRDVRNLNDFEYKDAYETFFVNGEPKSVGIVDFKKSDNNDASVDFRVEGFGRFADIKVDDLVPLNDGNKNIGNIKITRVRPGEVSFTFSPISGLEYRRGSRTIREFNSANVGSVVVEVLGIEIDEKASISIIPDIRGTETEANFTFRIGIEQRLFELSTNKALELQGNINDSIEKWENINSKLEVLLRAWKATCFATSTILNLKSTAASFDGESIARQEVMKEFKEKCDTSYKDISRFQCYDRHFSDEIDVAVKDYEEALKRVNARMDKVLSSGPFVSESLFGQGSVTDNEAYLKALRVELGVWSENIDGEVLTAKELTTTSHVRIALLSQEIERSNSLEAKKVVKGELEQTLASVSQYSKNNAELKALAEKYSFSGIDIPVSVVERGQKSFNDGGERRSASELRKIIVSGDNTVSKSFESAIGSKTSIGVQMIGVGGSTYLYLFEEAGIGENIQPVPLGVWSANRAGDKINLNKHYPAGLPEALGATVLIPTSRGTCSNPFNEGQMKVSYYESGRNQGLPALVSFDANDGWYAKVPNSAGTQFEDVPRGYTAGADVSYFSVCNIGADKMIETSDDFCQSVDANTQNSVSQIGGCGGLDEREVQRIYDDARSAIREAARQHPSREISINGRNIKVSEPRSDTGDIECTDYMSPEDCNLMFNVCDPVICPTSRCDLGGQYPVANVVQTGIVGSLALCLPNFPEVKVPICLTGVHAGLDSYISILKSEQQCLQENIDTGTYVGICDEITSVYKCEFFWGQLAPIAELAIPALLESASGNSQGVRGGGEYRTVQHAWDNLQNSVDFFQDEYAVSALRAFQIRSVSEAGGQLCSAFVGTSFPTSADALGSLLDPESPTQYTANFEEIPFTDATTPATSQYKVYFHIFAGNDKGVQYRVYLRDPPATSYYTASPTLEIARGFIGRGQSADEARDLTAPAGYKDLCVVVDGVENCGFGSVTTDIGLKLIKDNYISEQAEQTDVDSGDECISGAKSLLPLANLNVQQGLTNAIDPEIALDGIIRVCATNNPGGTVGQSIRWKDVGHCGDASTRCFLDTESVKENLERLQAFTKGTSETLNYRKGLIDQAGFTYEQVQNELSKVRSSIKELDENDLIVSESVENRNKPSYSFKVQGLLDTLDKIIGDSDYYFEGDDVVFEGNSLLTKAIPSGTNEDRAEALALKAGIYRMVTEYTRKGDRESFEGPRGTENSEGEGTGEGSEGGEDGRAEEEVDKEFEKAVNTDVFEVSRDGSNSIYYRFENGKWQSSLDRNNWRTIINSGSDNDNFGLTARLSISTSFISGKGEIDRVREELENDNSQSYVRVYSTDGFEKTFGDTGLLEESWFGFGSSVLIKYKDVGNLRCDDDGKIEIQNKKFIALMDGDGDLQIEVGGNAVDVVIDIGGAHTERYIGVRKDATGPLTFEAEDLYSCFTQDEESNSGDINNQKVFVSRDENFGEVDLESSFEDYSFDSLNSPFNPLGILGNYNWLSGGEILELEDVDLSPRGESGFLYLRVRQGYEVRFRITTNNRGFFDTEGVYNLGFVREIRNGDSIEFTLLGGGQLFVDPDQRKTTQDLDLSINFRDQLSFKGNSPRLEKIGLGIIISEGVEVEEYVWDMPIDDEVYVQLIGIKKSS